MSELVAMKGTKSGIVIVLNEEATFEELKQAVSEKFKESAAFWGEATKAVSFQGKKLSDDEKMQLVDCIQENCHLLIPCIMEEDEALETAFQRLTTVQDSFSKEIFAPDRCWMWKPALSSLEMSKQGQKLFLRGM